MKIIQALVKTSLILFATMGLFFLGISGCATTRIVGPDYRISLESNKEYTGVYRKGFQTVQYSYERFGDKFHIEGRVFSRGNVSTLDARILFVDKHGRKIGEKGLYYSGYRLFNTYGNSNRFKQSYILPAETTAIGFDFFVEQRTSRE